VTEVPQHARFLHCVLGATELDLSCDWGTNDSKKLTELPESLGQLTQLLELYLGDNPLNPELAAANEQWLDAVMAYLRAEAEDQIVLNEAKLILIGVEVDIQSFNLTESKSETEYTFNGWDFGGQSIYRHTHSCSSPPRLSTWPSGLRDVDRSNVASMSGSRWSSSVPTTNRDQTSGRESWS
jgi:hypothetical protein